MKTRALGNTGITIGELGLGTEYLNGQDRKTCETVSRRAVESGVNYFDVLFAFEEYRLNMGAAFKGLRDKCVITGHIGCAETKGQYRKTRDREECETLFEDLLVKLDTDHVEIVMVQFVDKQADYDRIMGPGGLYELAAAIRNKGQAKGIGISIHDRDIALQAAESGAFEVLMFAQGILADPLPIDHILTACEKNGVGFVAMKPYSGGRLFRFADQIDVDPTRLLGFPLLDSRITCVAPGVKNADELDAAIAGIENPADEETMERLAKELFVAGKGHCVYCNHCLPCPEEINIAEVMMHFDMAEGKKPSAELAEAYAKLDAHASDCSECGACVTRCPFEVPVIEQMQSAEALFGS